MDAEIDRKIDPKIEPKSTWEGSGRGSKSDRVPDPQKEARPTKAKRPLSAMLALLVGSLGRF